MSEATRRSSNEQGKINAALTVALGTLLLAGCAKGNVAPVRATTTPNQYVSGQALIDADIALDHRMATGQPVDIIEGVTVWDVGKGTPMLTVNAITTTINGQKAVGFISHDETDQKPQVELVMCNNPGDPTTDLPACQTGSWGSEPDTTGTVRSVIVGSQDLAISGNFIAIDPTTGQPIQTRYGDDMPVGMLSSGDDFPG